MVHFSLLHPHNANYEGTGKKVDVDDDLGLVSLFHVSMGGVNVVEFFCE
jgi:hypothetical protein